MEKFALLDFLKAFESLTGKASDAPDGKHAETEARPHRNGERDCPPRGNCKPRKK